MKEIFLGIHIGGEIRSAYTVSGNSISATTKSMSFEVVKENGRCRQNFLETKNWEEIFEYNISKMLRDIPYKKIFSYPDYSREEFREKTPSIDSSLAVIYNILDRFRKNKIPQLDFKERKNILVIDFGNIASSCTLYEVSEKEIRKKDGVCDYNLSVVNFNNLIKDYLSKKYGRNISEDLSKKLRTCLNNHIENHNYLGFTVFENIEIKIDKICFTLKEYTALFQKLLEENRENFCNEILKIMKNFHFDFYILDGESSKFFPLKTHLSQILKNTTILDTSEFSATEGASFYAFKSYNGDALKYFEDGKKRTFISKKIRENFIFELKRLYSKYEKAVFISTKKEILLEIIEFEKNLLTSKEGIEYLNEIIATFHREKGIALNRYFYLMGELGKRYSEYYDILGRIFLKQISVKALLELRSSQIPEYVVFSVIGLAKINYFPAETHLRDILNFPNCRKIYGIVIEVLGLLGEKIETFTLLESLFLESKLHRKEIYISLGRIAGIEKNIPREKFNFVLKNFSKLLLRERDEYHVVAILYAVSEICRKNNGIDEKILQDLRNVISDIPCENFEIMKSREIALKILNFKELSLIDLDKLYSQREMINF